MSTVVIFQFKLCQKTKQNNNNNNKNRSKDKNFNYSKQKDLSQFQWKSAHAPKKELPKDFL